MLRIDLIYLLPNSDISINNFTVTYLFLENSSEEENQDLSKIRYRISVNIIELNKTITTCCQVYSANNRLLSFGQEGYSRRRFYRDIESSPVLNHSSFAASLLADFSTLPQINTQVFNNYNRLIFYEASYV